MSRRDFDLLLAWVAALGALATGALILRATLRGGLEGAV